MTEPPAPLVPSPARPRVTTRLLAIPMFGLLGLEFVLGMVLNLFLSLPSGGGIVAILTSSPVLVVHLLIALTIIGISARALLVARREPGRRPLVGASIALVSAVIATSGGWSFAFYGQNPDASFVMSLGFLGVLVGAFLLLGHWGGETGLRGSSPVRGTRPVGETNTAVPPPG